MLRIKQNKETCEIISISESMMFLVLGCVVLQIIFIALMFMSLQTLSLREFFGYGLVNQILNVTIYSLPTLFILLIYLVMPIVKTDINRQSKIVSIKRLTPFSRPIKFGFDFITNGIRSNLETESETKKGTMYFELKSSKKVNVIPEGSETREKILEIIKKANSYFQ